MRPLFSLGVLLALFVSPPAQADQAVTEYAVRVEIQGAVKHPGVYRLPQGSRMAELVARAGGPKREAQLKAINLAEPLSDGEMCYIPTLKETGPVTALPVAALAPAAKHARHVAKTSGVLPAHPLDLNRATLEQLSEVPGLGPGLAGSIIRARQARGRFQSIEELREIGGFGLKRLERLRPYMAVN